MTQIIISLISNDWTAGYFVFETYCKFLFILILTFHFSVLNFCLYAKYWSTPWHYIFIFLYQSILYMWLAAVNLMENTWLYLHI